MGDTGIGSDQHAALTNQYGELLDQLKEVIQAVLSTVTDATSTGIMGDFSGAWLNLTHRVTADGRKAQEALKQLQDLLDKGRRGYDVVEVTSTRVMNALPHTYTNL